MTFIQQFTAAQMNEITGQLNALIYAVIGIAVAGSIALAATLKWYIPEYFKQQNKQREIQLKDLEERLSNKAQSDAVDIEREKMLPKLFEATISLSQNINQSMLQNAQQTALYIAQLSNHDRQLTTNTERLEGLAGVVDNAILTIQLIKDAVDKNTDHTKTAEIYAEQAAKAATETLETVKREINKLVTTAKHDTGKIKPLAEIQKESD